MYNTKARKKELLKYKVYICELCGNNGIWNKSNLNLQIDHIDGNSLNNDVANLRFLCPNCHSQTPTYAGRSAKNFNKPSREEFVQLVSNFTVKEIAVIKAVSLRTVYQWYNFFIREKRDLSKPRPSTSRKFNCTQVADIRKSAVGGGQLAKQYKTSHSLIKDIRKRRLYKDCN